MVDDPATTTTTNPAAQRDHRSGATAAATKYVRQLIGVTQRDRKPKPLLRTTETSEDENRLFPREIQDATAAIPNVVDRKVNNEEIVWSQTRYYSDLSRKHRRAASIAAVGGHNGGVQKDDGESIIVDKRSLTFPRRRRQLRLVSPMMRSVEAYSALFERSSSMIRFSVIRIIRWIEVMARCQYADVFEQ